MKTKLTPKEILIAYVSTLSDKKCKEAYQALQERFEVHRKKNMLFNRQGIEALAPEGKIRLTPNQYQLVLETYGEQGFHRLCEILYDYILYLEEKAPYEVVAKRRLKEYNKISHYYRLTKGWVAKRYEEENINNQSKATSNYENNFLSMGDVSSRSEAIEFIKSIPKHLRFDDVDVSYLISMYNISKEELQ